MKKKILLSTVFVCYLISSYGQLGELDSTFGNNGIVKTDLGAVYNSSSAGTYVLQSAESMYLIFGTSGLTLIEKRHLDGTRDFNYGNNGYSVPVALRDGHAAIQADGKIVVAGYAVDKSSYDHVQSFAVARFNTDGSLDKNFGNAGTAIINFGNSDHAYSVAIQTDGKIVVAGSTSYVNERTPDIVMARYNTDGSLDKKVTTDFATSENDADYGYALALQNDGKIVIAGSITIGDADYNFHLLTVRYNPDLTLDNTYSGDGKQITDIISQINFAKAVAIQSDGKIVVGGHVLNGTDYVNSTAYDFAVVRYNPDGTPDNSFSGDGKQTTDFGGADYVSSLIIQSDGKIVLAGYTNSGGNNNFALARYNTDGSPDDTFSGDGKQVTDFNVSADVLNSIFFQSDGKLLALGSTSDSQGTFIALARYNTDGNLDNALNGTGLLTSKLNQGDTHYTATAVQSDGKIIASGYTWNGSNYDFAIARYNTDGSPDNTFSGDGNQITDFNGGDDRVNSIAIQPDGKILLAGSSGANGILARYNNDGTPDNTFNGNGFLSLSYLLSKVFIQDDGKILLGGTAGGQYALIRYNSNGTSDSGFGVNGNKIVPNSILDIVTQSDGKIIVLGQITIFKYNVDGSEDLTFANDGEANLVFDINYISYPMSGRTIAIQEDGKIVVGGFIDLGERSSAPRFAIARFTNEGNHDNFGTNGFQIYNITGDAIGTSLNIQPNGKIILAGYSFNGVDNDFAIIRCNTDGTLDNTFSGDGAQITHASAGNDAITATAIGSDKLYAVGSGQFPGYFGIVARYLLNDEGQTPPAVSLISPANDTTYAAYGTAKINLNANASDADGTISKVEFYSNNGLLHTEFVAPYGYFWHSVTVGNYTITAKATDNDGNVTISNPIHISVVPDKAPTVNITSPANGASYTAWANIILSADASDVDGTIKKVDFYNGSALLFTETVAPYQKKWYSVPVGNYSITAKATDNNGRTTMSLPVIISVAPDIAPIVNITSPANNTTYVAPATIILSADASDVDGTIKKVDFYNGATLFHTENIAPYQFSLGYVPTGSYTLTAKATDNNGKITTSAPVAISVIAAGRSFVQEDKLNSYKEPLSLNLNPNPVASILNISVHGLRTNNNSTISVLSVSGAVIKTIQPGALNKNVQLDVSSLSGGVYFIKVINGDKVLYKQFVKL